MDYKLIPTLIDKDLIKFRLKTSKQISGCVHWTGSRYSGRYGRFWVLGAGDFLAHRISYYIHNSVDPEEKLVCHKCNNIICVNPEHLYLGDNSENQLQSWQESDRNQDGIKNPSSVLNETQVIEIRKLALFGVSYGGIAKQFNISKENVYQVVNHTWRHI